MVLRLSRSRETGGTLAEVVIGIALLTMFVATAFSAISFNRFTCAKTKEQAIVNDFLVHYLETLKGLRFADIRPGEPINALYDGTAGAPDVRIPSDSSWNSLNTPSFVAFHPDLVWLQDLNPAIQVVLSTGQVDGLDHDKHLRVTVRWDPPLHGGGELRARMDLFRVKDL